ncbi:hypothetical protein EI74_0172 [Mycoplasma testudineum]|uniref:Uncharacterized protein n=1 Tax=Mycoplasma testudineum TaxID=244584 RepID=A0A4R6IH37_9MOLU|nr:hypothetical protein [Mycoplasma testudineum]OYD27098.1 hypothetical protein CG473_00430 [Mycoplasma testudineum]TDO21151.1 hypothetical protein EI74_0172 [Mycoplasma testudineum]
MFKIKTIKAKLKKHRLFISISFAVFVIVGIGLGLFFTLSGNASSNTNPQTPKSTVNEKYAPLLSSQVFHEIDETYFYSAIKIHDGFIKIDQDIIAKIIKDQISRNTLGYGNITYEYILLTDTKILLSLIWSDSNNNSLTKTFEISAISL